MKVKNEAGEEIDVSTQEEVQAKIDAQKLEIEADHKKQLEEKDAALSTLSKDKEDLEAKIKKAELDGIKEDHPNFKILKDALTKKDDEIKNLNTRFEDGEKTRKTEAMNADIKIVSKGNAEFEKKVRLHLEKTLTALPEGTAEERKIKLDAAVKLSTDSSVDAPGIFDQGAGGGGYGGHGGGDGGGENKVEFNAREKALGHKMGITDEDHKKYDKDPRLVAMNKKK